MLKSTIKNGSRLEETDHVLIIDKHLIPFTDADRYNDNLVISGRPKGETFQFEMYATMQAISEEQLPTIAVVRFTEDITKVEFVRKLLSESKKRESEKATTHGS